MLLDTVTLLDSESCGLKRPVDMPDASFGGLWDADAGRP